MAQVSQLQLIAGAAMLYIGGRSAAEGLSGGTTSPGWRAVGHWLPIAAVAGVAVWLGQPEMALATLFASSIAALALVGGCVAIIGMTPDEPAVWPETTRRTTALLIPAAVLAYLAGFSGQFGGLTCSLLLGEGIILLIVWSIYREKSSLDLTRLIIALPLCGIGAWAAMRGAIGMNADVDYPPSMVAAATILAPLLCAPMLLSGSAMAQRGQAWAIHATLAGVAQLNICAGLPLVAIFWRLRWHAPLIYPLHNWRVDAVVLLLLSASLAPVAAGRWRPHRIEGAFHLLLYVVYVLAVIAVSVY
jgi:Ca2+/Na+ antiporter